MTKKVARKKADLLKISEAEAVELLGRRLGDEGFLVVPQVRNAVGARGRTTADAVMIQTWPSRELSITGVEYKRSRHDWRRELRNGQKAEPVAAYCHYWLVLAPKGVIPVEEVPAGWGLYEIDQRRRLLRTKAPPRQDTVKPIDLSFTASILRAAEKVNRSQAVLEADRAQLEAEFEERLKNRVSMKTRELRQLQEKVLVFEEASGIDISRAWGLERLGEGLAEFLKDPDQFRKRLRMDRNHLVRMLEITDTILGDE